jgi:hypothetical protein
LGIDIHFYLCYTGSQWLKTAMAGGKMTVTLANIKRRIAFAAIRGIQLKVRGHVFGISKAAERGILIHVGHKRRTHWIAWTFVKPRRQSLEDRVLHGGLHITWDVEDW